MADEIKQTGNIARVQPLNPSRGAGSRKRRPAPSDRKPEADEHERGSSDERPHRVDEYV